MTTSFVRPADPPHDLVVRVRGEFREMPGLCLTAAQAARLWWLDAGTCERVLAALVELRYLTRTAEGRYRRADEV